MLRRRRAGIASLTAALLTTLLLGTAASQTSAAPAYTASTPVLDAVSGSSADPAPWTLSQGDPSASPYGSSLPTFTFGGSPLVTFSGLTRPISPFIQAQLPIRLDQPRMPRLT